MHKTLLAVLTAAAIAQPSTAFALEYLLGTAAVDSGASVTSTVSSDQEDAVAASFSRLVDYDNATGIYQFSYALPTQSDLTTHPLRSVSSIGFGVAPNVSGGSMSGASRALIFDSAPAPFGVNLEVCATTLGAFCSGPAGATVRHSETGILTQKFTAGASSVGLGDFAIRYQSSSPTDDLSGRGFQSAIAEPGTWAMMLLGFGSIGMAIRGNRRRRQPLLQLA